MRFGPDQLVVSEVFDSFQGEGPSMGRRATFLRLGYCNLQCTWCDTKYTWDFARYDPDEEFTVRSLDEVRADLAARTSGRLIVTGGEPLLQHEALARLLPGLAGWQVEVETAGTIAPGALRAHVHQFNVSPKLASSGNPARRRLVPSALQAFAAIETAHFKFVVADERDAAEAMALAREHEMPRARIWFMPEAADAETLRSRAPEVAELAGRHGVHFGYRLHVALYGDRRGV